MEIETKAPNCPFRVQAAGHSFPPRTCRCQGWTAPAESQPHCGHSALGGLHVYLSHFSRRVWEEALQGGSWVTILVFICACVYMLGKHFIAAKASGPEPCSLAAACKDSLAGSILLSIGAQGTPSNPASTKASETPLGRKKEEGYRCHSAPTHARGGPVTSFLCVSSALCSRARSSLYAKGSCAHVCMGAL
jgi:hypothetical protein